MVLYPKLIWYRRKRRRSILIRFKSLRPWNTIDSDLSQQIRLNRTLSCLNRLPGRPDAEHHNIIITSRDKIACWPTWLFWTTVATLPIKQDSQFHMQPHLQAHWVYDFGALALLINGVTANGSSNDCEYDWARCIREQRELNLNENCSGRSFPTWFSLRPCQTSKCWVGLSCYLLLHEATYCLPYDTSRWKLPDCPSNPQQINFSDPQL